MGKWDLSTYPLFQGGSDLQWNGPGLRTLASGPDISGLLGKRDPMWPDREDGNPESPQDRGTPGTLEEELEELLGVEPFPKEHYIWVKSRDLNKMLRFVESQANQIQDLQGQLKLSTSKWDLEFFLNCK